MCEYTEYKIKKKLSLKTVCNGDTAYITKLNQQESKNVLLLRINVQNRSLYAS